jgi:type IV secretion system protein TrbI
VSEKTNSKKEPAKATTEKAADHGKSGQRFALGLTGILVVALLGSMFFETPPKKNEKDTDAFLDHSVPATNFSEQVKVVEGQMAADRIRNNAATTPSKSGDGTASATNPADWETQETLRALNSRKAGFKIKEREKADEASGSRSQQASSGEYRPPAIDDPRAAPAQTRGLPAHDPNGSQILSSGSAPGDEIVGRAVDDKNPDARKGNELLVPTGMVMDGVIDQDSNSDYVGAWGGHLIRDVYSVDKQFILFPKGTKIMGKSLRVSNINEPIQNRMGLTVEWAIFPNGKRVDFSKHTPQDQAGLGAFEGDVNRHLFAKLTSVAAYALVSASAPRNPTSPFGFTQPTFSGQFADASRSALLPLLTQYLSLVPTVTLKAGMPIKIITQHDMYIKPWARVNTTVY